MSKTNIAFKTTFKMPKMCTKNTDDAGAKYTRYVQKNLDKVHIFCNNLHIRYIIMLKIIKMTT